MTRIQYLLANVTCNLLILLMQCHPGSQLSFRMLTRSSTHSVAVGDMLILECEFYSPQYNLFNNPLLWIKTQADEVTQVNMMRNVNPPFRATGRFEVTFNNQNPRYTLTLTINAAVHEDSGNYTCEVRGPHSAIEGYVTHFVYVRDRVKAVLITTDNSTSELDWPQQSYTSGSISTSRNGGPLQILTFQEGKPSPLKCISKGGYPPPHLALFLGRKEISHQFQAALHTTLEGVKGLRVIEHISEQRTDAFISRAEYDGDSLRCVATSAGLLPVDTMALLQIDYAPIITCEPGSAVIGERNKHIACTIRAKPEPTLIYWTINSMGTRVTEGQVVNQHWTLVDKQRDGTIETRLYIKQVDVSHFHMYSVEAVNSVDSRSAITKLDQNLRSTASTMLTNRWKGSSKTDLRTGQQVELPNSGADLSQQIISIHLILHIMKYVAGTT